MFTICSAMMATAFFGAAVYYRKNAVRSGVMAIVMLAWGFATSYCYEHEAAVRTQERYYQWTKDNGQNAPMPKGFVHDADNSDTVYTSR